MVPRAACCFTRDSGSAGLFLDISGEAAAAANESGRGGGRAEAGGPGRRRNTGSSARYRAGLRDASSG